MAKGGKPSSSGLFLGFEHRGIRRLKVCLGRMPEPGLCPWRRAWRLALAAESGPSTLRFARSRGSQWMKVVKREATAQIGERGGPIAAVVFPACQPVAARGAKRSNPHSAPAAAKGYIQTLSPSSGLSTGVLSLGEAIPYRQGSLSLGERERARRRKRLCGWRPATARL